MSATMVLNSAERGLAGKLTSVHWNIVEKA